nr:gliding motility-associated C-terminal domain-containing protein [Spirosomataceae bacterium]
APVISSQKQITCSGQPVVLKATGCEGIVTWSNKKTGTSITVSPSETTTYTAHCEKDGCKSAVSNELKITVNIPATPSVKASKTSVCYGEAVKLTVSGCPGEVIWSNNQMGPEITVNPLVTTAYTATCRSEGCVSCFADEIIIKVLNAPPAVSASASAVCPDESVVLSANAVSCAGTLKWSNGATGSSITVKPQSTQTYTATCETPTCIALSSSVQVSVAPPPPPVVKSSRSVICNGESLTLTAENCSGTVKWNNGQTGNSIVLKPSQTASYRATCVRNGCESTTSEALVVNVGGAIPATPSVKNNLTNTCPFQTVDLSAAIQNRVIGLFYEAHTGNTPDSPEVASVGSVSQNGSYFIFARNDIGCFSLPAEVKVTIQTCDNGLPPCITNPATAKIVKAEKTTSGNYFLQSQVGGVAKTGQWATSGSGSFSNVVGLSTVYTPSDEDRKAGVITVAFSTEDPDNGGPCKAGTTTQNMSIEALAEKPKEAVGLTKTVINFVKLDGRRFQVTYKMQLSNMGNNDLAEVQLTDSLDRTFKNGAIIASKPIVKVFFNNSTTEAKEMADTTFTGQNGKYDLLVPEYAVLPKGQNLSVELTVTVNAAPSSDTIFYNRAFVRALDVNGNMCEDLSDNAQTPDANGNGDAADDSNPTPISINGFGGSAEKDLFIPEGFSPNGDGINDAFVIRKPNTLRLSLEIYNRLGGLVYRNEDYKNEWKGEGSTRTPLPAGTYFYVVRTNDGREFSRFLTLGR